MFVTIKKPTKSNMLKVSMKQYENKYKRLGYMIVGGSMKTEEVEEPEHEVVEQDIIEEDSEDIESIPISEMNKEQLMRFAKVHNINTHIFIAVIFFIISSLDKIYFFTNHNRISSLGK